jgi:hypothetical protein
VTVQAEPPPRTAADWFALVFYVAVASLALVGNVIASATWLPWPWELRGIVMGVFELGGVAVAAFADARRRLGETALFANVMSVGIAASAVMLNWLGHRNHVTGAAFAALSALAYAFWVLRSGARRRDALRAAGKLRDSAPKYGPAQWLTQPRLTWEARALALNDPDLGRAGSLAHAAALRRRAARHASALQAVRELIAAGVEPAKRSVALATLDLEQIVARMEADADNVGMARALGAGLSADRITETARVRGRLPTTSTGRGPAPAASQETGNRGRQSLAVPLAPEARKGDRRRGRVSRDRWWNAAREKIYQEYARRLDAGEAEMTAREMRTALGVKTDAGARDAREHFLRPRYAREVAEGARRPTAEAAPAPGSTARVLAAAQ